MDVNTRKSKHLSEGTSAFLRVHSQLIFVAAAAVALLCARPAVATPSAREVLDQARHLTQTTRKWSDRVQRMSLRIIDRRGGERQRVLLMSFKKYADDKTRSTVFFESPPEVKGVALLQWADPHAKDTQWLYLPELERVRQISAGARHESFMGTDFSYDDLAIITQSADWTEADARATLIRDEAVDGRDCHVIEFVPTGKDLTYSKVVTWLSVADSVMLKFEMYDKGGRLEKLLTLTNLRDVGSIPTFFDMEMKNEQSGSRTVVHFEEVRYDTGLADDLFTQRALESSR